MPFQMPQIENNIGNALAGIGQMRQQRTQNALAERQLGLQEAQGRRVQQQFDAEQAATQRAQMIETTKGVLGALARVPQAQRQQAFAQLAGDLPPEFVQRMSGNPDAFTDQNIALALNRFGTLTPDQLFSDQRREAQAKTPGEKIVVRGPDGRPTIQFADRFDTDARYEESAGAGAELSAATSRSNAALAAATARRGQDMADARARDAARLQAQHLGRPVELTDPTTGQPVLVQFDRQGRPVRVPGLAPKGAGGDIAALQASLANADSQIALVDAAIRHPGRTSATGVLSAVPTLPGSDTADFEAILEQIRGAAFLQAFQSLKGGGAITEQEGRKAEAAIARLQLSQSDEAFEASLRDLRSVLQNGKKRAAARLPPASPDGNVIDWSDL